MATAEYFALRRQGTILEYQISGSAIEILTESGATIQNIPAGKVNLPGYEFFIPPSSFSTFNSLKASGEINVVPAQ